MLLELIELRDRKWIPRNQVAAPTTIAAVHEAAAKERILQEKENSNRTLSMSRGGSRRGAERGGGGEHAQGVDGWSVAGGNVPRPPPKAGDLSNFGKINKVQPMTFGPSSVFAGKKPKAGDLSNFGKINKVQPMTFGPSSVFAGKKEGVTATRRESTTLSRTNSSSNMFSMLSGGEDSASAAAAKARPGSRRTSVDLGQPGVSEPPVQRRKLQLLPRSRPVEESEGVPEAALVMSEEEANKKISEDNTVLLSLF